MRKKILILLLMFTVGAFLHAQQAVYTVTSDFGFGPNPPNCIATSMRLTHDNGGISNANFELPTSSFNMQIKRDSVGNIQWANKWDFDTIHNRETTSIPCAYNGYMSYSLGYTNSPASAVGVGHYQGIRTDVNGNLLWSKLYRSQSLYYTIGGCQFKQLADGGYMVVGLATYGSSQYEHSIHVMRIDSVGNVLWSNLYTNLVTMDMGPAVMEICKNGDLLVCNLLKRPDCTDYMCIVRIDPSGNLIWTKKYHTTTTGSDSPLGIREAANNEIVVYGIYSDSQLGHTYMLMRLDSTGQIIWGKAYAWSIYDISVSSTSNNNLFITSDGGYLIYNWCMTSSLFGLQMKTDSAGNELWNRIYSDYYFPKGDMTPSCGLLMSSAVGSVQKSARMTNAGISQCASLVLPVTVSPITLNITTDTFFLPLPLNVVDGAVIITPTTVTDNLPCGSSVGIAENASTHFSVYPNPASDLVTLENLPNDYKLSVYNTEGQLMYEGRPSNNSLEVENWPSGFYLFRIEANNTISTQKILISK